MTTIDDAARKVTELPGTLWASYDEAPTSATSYAIDLGIDTGTQSGVASERGEG